MPIGEAHTSLSSEFTTRAQRPVTGRRGDLVLGFDAKLGWTGWDRVSACILQVEGSDGVVGLRSLTMMVGSFTWALHHLQELVGRDADKVVDPREEARPSRASSFFISHGRSRTAPHWALLVIPTCPVNQSLSD